MSDFLVSFDPEVSGESLLRLLRQPYDGRAVPGTALSLPRGAAVILEDPIPCGPNVVRAGAMAFGWIGDLVFPGGAAALRQALESDFGGGDRPMTVDEFTVRLERGSLLRQLNGGFAGLLIGSSWACVITDPMASVQLYLATDADGEPRAVGSHPDLVARCVSDVDHFDPISVCDFMNAGTPCCPHTMHRDVKEIVGGAAVIISGLDGPRRHLREIRYWQPPSEMDERVTLRDAAMEFAETWKKAVLRRCDHAPIGSQLSGGLDSRMVLAVIPEAMDCTTLTLCDEMNRETRIAKRVAEAYHRKWMPLQRDPEYVAQTARQSTQFTGCEGEWHHAHTLGFARQLGELGFKSVFTGLYMDNNFKGYYVKDYVQVQRAGGLLPPTYRKRTLDYASQIHRFCHTHLQPQIVEDCRGRRQEFVRGHFAMNRQSAWEWLDGYPVTQASDNTGWIVERRVLPMRLPVMDRALVDLAFRIPIRLKAGGAMYQLATRFVLGPGRTIPNANDGVRPGSGHLSRVAQRSLRKLENNGRQLLQRLGVQLGVPHSWHDYQRYWRESDVLRSLVREHGPNLQALEGGIFHTPTAALLADPQLPWRIALRLVQLGLWQSIIRDYRLQRSPSPTPTIVAA